VSSEPQRLAPPPGYLDLAHICGHLIRRSQQIHTAIWIDEFGAELTSPQYAVLAALALQPGIDQRRLGELVSLDKSSAADVVARLEAKMWLKRTRDPNDARRNLLELSPAAIFAVERLAPMARRVQDRLIAPVPVTDRPTFIDSLTVVARVDHVSPGHQRGAAQIAPFDDPGHLIRRAQQVHTAIWAEEFDRELTGPQYAAMQVLSRSPEINQRVLGEKAALDKSTAADIVLRLVRRGSIVRHRDPEDGRGWVLRLSDEAHDLTRELAPRVSSVQDRLLAPLEPAARDEFLTLLALVAYAGDVPTV
jgi:MarR family transcriptional regulator, lower aerobic nicotinate degradation pathway regulator